MTNNNLEKLTIEWNKNHEKSIQSIQKTLSSQSEYDADFIKLANFLLRPEINLYDVVLDIKWASSKGQATDFDGFLHTIHHAMIDDGELSFLKFENGKCLMDFCWNNEPGCEERVFNLYQKNQGKPPAQYSKHFQFEVLNGVNEFIEAFNQNMKSKAARITEHEKTMKSFKL